MRKALFSCAALVVFLAGVWSASAAPPNFAGTWTLDKSKSELSGRMANIESMTYTITQDAKTITIESKVEGGGGGPGGGGGGGGRGGGMMGPQKTTYNLDGSETSVDLQNGKAKLKAKWLDDGKTLELTNVTNANFQGQEVTITTKQHLELADGGKVLKVHQTRETPRGTQETKLTFNKSA